MNSATPMSRSAYAHKLREFSSIAFAGQSVFAQRGRWAELFRGRIGSGFNSRIILEIGCSDARYLSTIAAEHPDTAFVGIDWKCKAICAGAEHILARGLRNIALLHARGHDLLKLFSTAELNEIWIFHPDPCDKEAELKNRLIGERFLLQASAVLKDRTSLVALKTDHHVYFQSVIDLFQFGGMSADQCIGQSIQDRLHIAISSASYWQDPIAVSHTAERFFAKRMTPFERRFNKKHLPIYYLELRKNKAGLARAQKQF